MLKSQQQFFTRRSLRRGIHDGHISSAYNLGKNTEDFRSLASTVYSDHRSGIVFNEPGKFLTGENLPSPEYLTWLFHTKKDDAAAKKDSQSYFIKPNLFKGGPKGAPLQLIDFENKICQHKLNDKKNNVLFLVGEIGMGKSTLISHLLVNKGASWLKNDYIPIHIDTDSTNKHGLPSLTKAVKILHEQVINELYRITRETNDVHYHEVTKIQTNSSPSKLIENGKKRWEEAFTSVANLTRKHTNKRLVLFIDNLDYLYHLHDREHFTDKRNRKSKKARKFIKNFISLFTDWGDGSLKDLGLNVVFTLRPDSLAQLQRDVHLLGSNHQFKDDEGIFYYEPPNTYSVLLGRYRMLNDAVELIEDKGKADLYLVHMKAYEDILNFWTVGDTKKARSNCDKNLLERLSLLSKQGLRQVLDHMSKYTWIGENGSDSMGADIDKRFAMQSSPSVLAFTLNGYRMFSQIQSVFPNFYLVDSKVTARTHNDLGFKEDLLAPHRHTYWLKRLIAEFVLEKSKDKVTFSDVIDIFSCTSDDPNKPNGYEENIIRLSIASLCQTDLSAVLYPEFDIGMGGTSLGVGELHPTERGKYILECFIDTFEYLQLIVDDYLLSFPKCVDSVMSYSESRDYGYLIVNSDDYARKTRHMVSYKARQVFVFIELLRSSLEVEKALYKPVFDRLEMAGITIPSVEKIEENVVNHINNLRPMLNLENAIGYRDDAINKKCIIEDEMITIYSYAI